MNANEIEIGGEYSAGSTYKRVKVLSKSVDVNGDDRVTVIRWVASRQAWTKATTYLFASALEPIQAA